MASTYFKAVFKFVTTTKSLIYYLSESKTNINSRGVVFCKGQMDGKISQIY